MSVETINIVLVSEDATNAKYFGLTMQPEIDVNHVTSIAEAESVLGDNAGYHGVMVYETMEQIGNGEAIKFLNEIDETGMFGFVGLYTSKPPETKINKRIRVFDLLVKQKVIKEAIVESIAIAEC